MLNQVGKRSDLRVVKQCLNSHMTGLIELDCSPTMTGLTLE